MRPLKKADWTRFTKALQMENTSDISQEISTEELAARVTSNVTEALDSSAPKKAHTISPSNVWWCKELEQKRNMLKKLFRKISNNASTQQRYKELRREYVGSIRAAKQKSWENFITKAEGAKNISKIVKILENPPERVMGLLEDHNGDGPLQPGERLAHLLRVHFPDGIIDGEEGTCLLNEHNDYGEINSFISPAKVKAALGSFGDFKSPGPDEIPPVALKHLDDRHLHLVCLLYRKSLKEGCIPNTWRNMKVVFIPKAGKEDYSVAKAYRPITLSNFLFKGLERIVQWYILQYIVTKPLYNQHAYTKDKSCDSALSAFVSDIEHSIYNGNKVLAVSLDCSGAFDCIKFQSAKLCMAEKGIPNSVITWYTNLLKCRKVTADLQGLKKHVIPKRGSPQGGVLSPLIWNLIMDNLLSTFKRGPIRVIGYADDILVYIKGTSPTEMAELLQPALNKIEEWGAKHGLTFNPNKTTMVLFSLNRRFPPFELSLWGTKLDLSRSMKYLGDRIHQSLSWCRHVVERANKCKALLGKCRTLVHRAWGLAPTKLQCGPANRGINFVSQ